MNYTNKPTTNDDIASPYKTYKDKDVPNVELSDRKNERIQYIDAVRGITMLIVVFQHIRAFSFGLYKEDSILSMVYLSFMLPMFFFISGFASYRRATISVFSKITEKFRQLVIPSIVFLLLHNYFPSYQEKWGFPGGYWFTVSLFGIIIVYLILSQLLQRLSNGKFLITLLIISFVFTILRGYFGIILDSGWPTYITLRKILSYFIFFVLGIGVRVYIKRVNELCASPWCRNLLIITVLFGFIASVALSKVLPNSIYSIYRLFLDITSTLLIFMIFNITRQWWNNNNLVSKWICFVGRRTLDLYMIHYFFLPNLTQYGYLFKSTGNCAIEIIVMGFITIIITILSLSIGELIRLSPFLSYWILGTKNLSQK